MKSIIIFGGSGYVGKNLIRSFVKKGYKIIIPYQKQIDEANLRLFGSVGQIIPFHFTSLKNPKLLSVLKNADICINLKTTWDSKESYLEKSIYKFNAELIEIIKESNSIKKFIFFSGLGTERRSTLRNEIISKTEELITKELKSEGYELPIKRKLTYKTLKDLWKTYSENSDDDELFKSLTKADIMIVPALWGEGFGLPVIEAYSLGLKVIASNVCALPEVIISKNHLFESNLKSLKYAMDNAIEDNTDVKSYYLENFSKKIILNSYMDLYKL